MDVLGSILAVGTLIGRQSAALSLQQQLQARIQRVAVRVAGLPRRRMLSLEGLSPLVLGGHWLAEMKMLSGAHPGLQGPGARAEKVSWDTVLAFAPEILVLAPCSSSVQRTLAEVSPRLP